MKPEDLKEEDKALLQSVLDCGVEMVTSSCLTDVGVFDVRNLACEKLLALRVDAKIKGQKINDVLNKLHLAEPVPRDDKMRTPFVPESVKQRMQLPTLASGALEKDLERENGGPGVYSVDHRKNYMLKNEEWKYDDIPEIMNGKNIADFIDPEIDARLLELEEEEERLQQEGAYEEDAEELTEEQIETRKTAALIKEKKSLIVQAHRLAKRRNRPPVPAKILKTRPARPAESASMPKKRSLHADEMDIDGSSSSKRPRPQSLAEKARSRSKLRDRSVLGLREDDIKKTNKLKQKAQTGYTKHGRKGEADRAISASKPKHLYSGKRGIGSTDRR
jgi:nucleolar GTP-binding protein